MWKGLEYFSPRHNRLGEARVRSDYQAFERPIRNSLFQKTMIPYMQVVFGALLI